MDLARALLSNTLDAVTQLRGSGTKMTSAISLTLAISLRNNINRQLGGKQAAGFSCHEVPPSCSVPRRSAVVILGQCATTLRVVSIATRSVAAHSCKSQLAVNQFGFGILRF